MRSRGVVVVGLVAVALVLVATWRSVGLTVDGAEYVHAADSIATGHGVTVPYVGPDEPYPAHPRPDQRTLVTHFAPLYPASLAVLVKLGLTPTQAARAEGVALLVAFVALLAAAMALAGRTGRRAVVVALALSPPVIVAFAMAWSEPLFLVLLLGALCAMFQLHRARSPRAEILLVALCALAPLARYLGLSVAMGACLLVSSGRLPVRSKRTMTIACALAGVVPTVAWQAYVHGRATTDSGWGVHLPGWADWSSALGVVGGWLVDIPTAFEHGVPAWIGAVVLAAAGAIVLRLRRRSMSIAASATPATVACVTVGACYLLVLVGARSVFDANIDFDSRQLATLYVLGVLAVATSNLAFARVARLALAAFVAVVAARTTVTTLQFPGSELSGFTADRWRHSPALAALRSNGCGGIVLTNAPDPVHLYTSCRTMKLPPEQNIYRDAVNDRYGAQLDQLARFVADHPTSVVFFDRPTRATGRRRIDPRVIDALGLRLVSSDRDASIYRTTASS